MNALYRLYFRIRDRLTCLWLGHETTYFIQPFANAPTKSGYACWRCGKPNRRLT